MGLPEFTSVQSRRLRQLGLCSQQIEKLRIAIAVSAIWLNHPPSKNDTLNLLNEVEDLSKRLATRLSALAVARDAAHGAANALIEERYWERRPEDLGLTASHNMVPRLQALAHSACDAKEALPEGQTRLRAYPEPIGRIDAAMRDGWRAAYGSHARHTDEQQPTVRAYPPEFYPSSSPTSTFRQVCGICYEVAGFGNEADPERAIKAFMRHLNRHKKEALGAIEMGLAVTRNHPKDSRPSKK